MALGERIGLQGKEKNETKKREMEMQLLFQFFLLKFFFRAVFGQTAVYGFAFAGVKIAILYLVFFFARGTRFRLYL